MTSDKRGPVTEEFTARQELDILEQWHQFGIPGAPQVEAFRQCLAVIAQECGVSIGKLRPDDSLETVMGKPESRNPVTWLFGRAAFEDRSSELSFVLKKRRKSLGLSELPPQTPGSVRDYVLAWLPTKE